MPRRAELRGVVTLDNSPAIQSVAKLLAFGKAAAIQFKNNPFKTTAIIGGLAGEGAVRGIASGLVKVGEIGATAFKAIGAGALAAGVAIGVGTVKVLNLGGGLVDLANQTSTAVGKLTVLTQALGDAGVASEEVGAFVNKMQKFIEQVAAGTPGATAVMDRLGLRLESIDDLSPDEQLARIGAAIGALEIPSTRTAAALAIFGRSGGKLQSFFTDLKNGGLAGAADVVGRQAQLLEKNALLFDKVSDQLGHAGTKLQGFFVGVADRIAKTLSPLLDRLDKVDLAGVGQKFGDGIIRGVQAFFGAFRNPREFAAFFEEAFDYAFKSGGNILISVFKSGVDFFKNGMISTLAGIGQTIIATLMDAFAKPIAYFQAAIEKVFETTHDVAEDVGFSFMGSEATTAGDSGMMQVIADAQKKAAEERGKRKKVSVSERADAIAKEGVRFGLGDGMTAGEWRAEAAKNINAGISAAFNAAKSLKVSDMLGASAASSRMGMHFMNLARIGAATIPSPGASPAVVPVGIPPLSRFATPASTNAGDLGLRFGAVRRNFGVWSGFGANQFGTSFISDRNRMGIPDGLGIGHDQAYGLVRRGDAARRKAAEDEKKKGGDPMLKNLRAATRNMKALGDVWGAQGTQEPE